MTEKSKVPMPSDVIRTPEMTEEEYYQARMKKKAEFFECMKKKQAELIRAQFAFFERQKMEILAAVDKKIKDALAA